MKKSILLIIGIAVCLLSFAGCREALPRVSSQWEGMTPVTTTGLPETETTATSTATATSTTATARATAKTTRGTTSQPVIKKTVDKTTAKPVTVSTTTTKPTTTTKSTTTKPTTATTLPAGDVLREVTTLVNEDRARAGTAALTYRSDLQGCADLRAREIIQHFSHTRPNGSNCFTVLTDAGISYRAVGENIAYGQRSADEVMTAWMNSEGHKDNILSGDFTGIAVGYAEQNGVKYWVQLFVA